MSKLVIDKDLCKSCQYCIAACPKQALCVSSDRNKAGYNYVTADEEKCIACGICYSICPDYVFSIQD